MKGEQANGGSSMGVLLLHGIGLMPVWNSALARNLRRDGHRPVLNWGYPPRTAGIAAVAERIALRLRRRFPDGVPALHAVGHSMGGLVIRKLLADGALPPGGRSVFLGTPHAGARKAEIFGDWWVYRAVFGESGQDLRPGSDFLRSLPERPAGEYMVVVSGTGKRGLSLLLHEDNDGTVEVSSARLAGARELFVARLHHGLMPFSPQVRRAIRAFLDEGGPPAPGLLT